MKRKRDEICFHIHHPNGSKTPIRTYHELKKFEKKYFPERYSDDGMEFDEDGERDEPPLKRRKLSVKPKKNGKKTIFDLVIPLLKKISRTLTHEKGKKLSKTDIEKFRFSHDTDSPYQLCNLKWTFRETADIFSLHWLPTVPDAGNYVIEVSRDKSNPTKSCEVLCSWNGITVRNQIISNRQLTRTILQYLQLDSFIIPCNKVCHFHHHTLFSSCSSVSDSRILRWTSGKNKSSRSSIQVRVHRASTDLNYQIYESLDCRGFTHKKIIKSKLDKFQYFRCEHCSKIHDDCEWLKKSSELKKEFVFVGTEYEKLQNEVKRWKTMYEDAKKKLDRYERHGIVRDLLKCIEEGRLKGIAQDFFHEEIKIRMKNTRSNFKWLNFPTVFGFFQEVREFCGSKCYRLFSGTGSYKNGFFEGILAAPSERTLNKKVREYKYFPGLCKNPLITVVHMLKSLGFVRGCANFQGDDINIKSGLDRIHIQKPLTVRNSGGKAGKSKMDKSYPCWFGKQAVDSYDQLNSVLKNVRIEKDKLKQKLIHVRDDTSTTEKISLLEKQIENCNNLIWDIESLQRTEKSGQVAKYVCQTYLNVCGKFKSNSGDITQKTLKFPLFYFVHRQFDNNDLAAVICSSIIYTDQYLKKELNKPLSIDSVTWDGDKAVKSFISRYLMNDLTFPQQQEDCLTEQECPKKLVNYIKRLIGNTRCFGIPMIRNLLVFVNDTGHKLKNLRNHVYNLYESNKKLKKEDPSQVHHFKFIVKDSESYRMGNIQLFEVLDILTRCFRRGDEKLGCRVNSNHLKLTTYSKMNQRLCSEVFNLKTLKAIENSVLCRLLGTKSVSYVDQPADLRNIGIEAGDNDENEEEPDHADKTTTSVNLESHLSDEGDDPYDDLLYVKLSDDYDGDLTATADFFLRDHKDILHQQSWAGPVLKKREKELGIPLIDLLATMNFISYWVRERSIFKSRRWIEKNSDSVFSQVESLRAFLFDYIQQMYYFCGSNSCTEKEFSKNIFPELYVVSTFTNIYAFQDLITHRLKRGYTSQPIATFSQDTVESHFACIRMFSGLNSNPTASGYHNRLAHVTLRLQYKFKESTYEFSPTMDHSSSSKLVSNDLFKKLKSQNEHDLSSLYHKFLRNKPSCLEYLTNSHTICLTPPSLTKLKQANLEYVVGYCLGSLKKLYKRELSFFSKARNKKESKLNHPSDYFIRFFSIVDNNIRQVLGFRVLWMYYDVVEVALLQYVSENFIGRFFDDEDNGGIEKNDENERIMHNMLKKYIKIVTYREFESLSLLSGKMKKVFRKKIN